MKPQLKKRLGDLLVEEQLVTEAQLGNALKEQRNLGLKLGATLIHLGYISEDQILTFLSRQLNIDIVDLLKVKIDPNAVQLIPEVHARRLRALAIHDNGEVVTLVVSDPADLHSLDVLSTLLKGRTFELMLAREDQLIESFDRVYRRTKEIASFAVKLSEEHGETSAFDVSGLDLGGEGSDATVVKLLQSLFEDAVQVGASDIHIEPDEKVLRIRQRVDGVLQETLLPESGIASALVLRLKLMSQLDISEKRMPQDGRFNINVKGKSIDIRVSTMPIQEGESVVMRLLDQSAGVLSFDEIGIPENLQERLELQLKRPNGLILVTGPTGSGKTTTLYSALNILNAPGSKIITVEDPVEYRLPRVNQVQVNSKIGLDFSTVLRTALRQDPDILLVGEMRDNETMEIGLRGALTGHLVLSTLHTNDAISSTLRLLDMGAPGYLVASALRAVVAQRLIRRLCENCKTSHEPPFEQQVLLEQLTGEPLTQTPFYSAPGCQRCQFTGYRGRIGVFELLELDNAMVSALRLDDTEAFSIAAKNSTYFQPLAIAALDYAKQGITSLEEVFKLVDRFEKVTSASSASNDPKNEPFENELTLAPRDDQTKDYPN
ncbi:MSHA biogenesis protein MshE [Psychromonas sp. psych-6C06]|uniref:GspE/PulE family protein n=1 Tax=Psychromonas sp. psych-6C06 TaxID=2058089 RepID=UPI000C32DB66|nr:GspE/PulE family protein [Psychromonas sp. psych-6C06]PKF62958.1 MSHA biogenesis protein MshE [Psychromonas sp. psych-6C06]